MSQALTDYLIALALLFGSAEPPADWTPGVCDAFRALVSEWELDEGAQSFWWLGGAYWRVTSARGQLHLLRDAPPMADTRRLPPYDLCREWSIASQKAREWLQVRASMDARTCEQIELALYEDATRHAALSEMVTASDDGLAATTRRAALQRLRHLIGPVAYTRGDWPAPIPFHLMPRLP